MAPRGGPPPKPGGGTTVVMEPGFERALLRSTELMGWLKDRITEAEANAVRLAPERLGFLKDSIESEVGFAEGQLIARLRARDFKAPWYELGSIRTPPEPFLRPGLEEAVPFATWEAKTR